MFKLKSCWHITSEKPIKDKKNNDLYKCKKCNTFSLTFKQINSLKR